MATPFVPAPNVMQVEMVFNYNGEHVENVYHVMYPGDITDDDFTSLYNGFLNWNGTLANQTRPSTCSLIAIILTDLTTAESRRTVYGVAPPQVGFEAGAAMPGNVTFALQLVTAERGRGAQGRTYWIGITEDDCVGNIFIPAAADLRVTALETLRTDIETDTAGLLAVLHSMEGGALLNPRVATPVTAIRYTNTVLDSQISRLPGHRRHKKPGPPPTP